jgi:EpsI family protein
LKIGDWKFQNCDGPPTISNQQSTISYFKFMGFNARFWLLLAVLLAGGGFIHWWQRAGEAAAARRPLREFPAELGGWRQSGADERFSPEAEKVLRADDYLSRYYTGPGGAWVSFYVGYYATQRHGATYHSPLNCLPGAGWVMSDPQLVSVQPRSGAAFAANRYLITNGGQRQLLLYWYAGRGRRVASEYWGKIFTVWDSIARRRSDGAMVRVMLPLGDDEAAATRVAVQFAAAADPYLAEFVPD